VSRLQTLSTANAHEALAYLAQSPFDNVYVGWLIGSGRLNRGAEVALWRDDCERIAGASLCGPQIVLCGETAEAIDEFADASKRTHSVRMIVGPRVAVERFWARSRARFPEPAVFRSSQPVYMLDRASLRFGRDDADVARATLAELDEIVPNSAQMIAGEIGGDPHNATAAFRERTQRLIEHGWWWRYRVDDALAFMCNVGSAAFGTAQLQGVWTPPQMRGRGYATRALGAICDRLLDEHASLCLYVNDFNAPAIALYERVGFTRSGEFQTILFT
jgi:RimJ/RimL family protein N-acetyltransferase